MEVKFKIFFELNLLVLVEFHIISSCLGMKSFTLQENRYYLEMNDSGKHTSLLWYGMNYCRKSFMTQVLGLCCLKSMYYIRYQWYWLSYLSPSLLYYRWNLSQLLLRPFIKFDSKVQTFMNELFYFARKSLLPRDDWQWQTH